MAVEEQRLRVRRSLEEKLGVEEASYLMDRPVGGWSDLVTNHTLDLKFRVLDERFALIDERFVALDTRLDQRFAQVDERFRSLEDRFDAKLDSLEHQLRAEINEGFRRQTWALLTAVIAGMGVMGAIFGVLLLIAPGA